MSHTTTLKTVKIVDIDALQRAVNYLAEEEKVNISLVKNARPRMYSRDQEVMCDYVVKLPKSRYDVGFQKQKDGSYVPIFDTYLNSIRNQIGAAQTVEADTPEEIAMLSVSRLVDVYAIMAVKNQLSEEGFGYSTEVSYNKEDNSYCLVVSDGY